MKGEKESLHFGWVVFAGMCIYLFGLYDVTYNSLFVLPLASALGVTRGAVLAFASCYSISGILMSMFAGVLLAHKRIPLWILMVGGVIVQEISYCLFAFGDSIWTLYLAGFLLGLPVQGCTVVMPTVFASYWYADRIRGRLHSIQNSVRGFAGIIWPVIIQLIINQWGYRSGYYVLMLAAVAPLVMGFVIRWRSPSELGIKPLGYRDEDAIRYKVSKCNSLSIGWNLPHAVKTAGFWFLVLTVAAFGMENGFASNFSGIAAEFLEGQMWIDSAMVAATMLAWRSVGTMVGNFTVGFVMDIIGAWKTSLIWLGLFSLFFVVVLLFGHNEYGLYVAALFFGLNSSILRNPIPMTVRDMFGARYFSSIWGVINAIKPVVSGVAATCIAISYDLTGSYYGAIVYGFAMAAVTLIFFYIGSRFINSYDYVNNPDIEKMGYTKNA